MTPKDLTVLGIETSCDETAAAVVTGGRNILSNLVHSQFEEHELYGGVVPEIAARAHLEHLDGIIARALTEANLAFADLDGIAATAGPGLIGGVMVGVMTAKAIAAASHLPFVGINHLEAHALTIRMIEPIQFPYLLLLISGGHCQILIAHDVGHYEKLGATIDDAAGEAFDKVAKLLNLPQPGGPSVEQAAKTGDPKRFNLPRPMRRRAGCDFSFSGLKTAVRHLVVNGLNDAPTDQDRADICASFQAAVGDVLVDRLTNALAIIDDRGLGAIPIVIAGGVAANDALRTRLGDLETLANASAIHAPPPALCTDNAAMVAWAGIENLRQGKSSGLDLEPRPRWPLEHLHGAGSMQTNATAGIG